MLNTTLLIIGTVATVICAITGVISVWPRISAVPDIADRTKNIAARVFLFALFVAIIAEGALDFSVRHAMMEGIDSGAVASSSSLSLSWPAMSHEDIKTLSDRLSGIQGVKLTEIDYANADVEPFAVAIAQAMRLAGWPQPVIEPGPLILGLRVDVGSNVAQAGNAVRTFLKEKTGETSQLGDMGAGMVRVQVGVVPPK